LINHARKARITLSNSGDVRPGVRRYGVVACPTLRRLRAILYTFRTLIRL